MLRLHIKKRNQALIKLTLPEVISMRVVWSGTLRALSTTITIMASATKVFTQARMKYHVQTVEFDTSRKRVGSVAIILY